MPEIGQSESEEYWNPPAYILIISPKEYVVTGIK